MIKQLESFGATTTNTIERTIVRTGITYEALLEQFQREVGHWDPELEETLPARQASWEEFRDEVSRIGGSRGLMIFRKIDQGAITSLSGNTKRCTLFLIGNPVIASRILDIDLRAALYVPFRTSIYDDSAHGVSLIYDRPSSFLAALGNPELTEIGAELDAKIDALALTLCGA